MSTIKNGVLQRRISSLQLYTVLLGLTLSGWASCDSPRSNIERLACLKNQQSTARVQQRQHERHQADAQQRQHSAPLQNAHARRMRAQSGFRSKQNASSSQSPRSGYTPLSRTKTKQTKRSIRRQQHQQRTKNMLAELQAARERRAQQQRNDQARIAAGNSASMASSVRMQPRKNNSQIAAKRHAQALRSGNGSRSAALSQSSRSSRVKRRANVARSQTVRVIDTSK